MTRGRSRASSIALIELEDASKWVGCGCVSSSSPVRLGDELAAGTLTGGIGSDTLALCYALEDAERGGDASKEGEMVVVSGEGPLTCSMIRCKPVPA